MPITALDQVAAATQAPRVFNKGLTGTMAAQRAVSTWLLGGNPGAGGTARHPNTGGNVRTSADNGALKFDDPGAAAAHLAHLSAASSGSPGTLVLCDRLWDVMFDLPNSTPLVDIPIVSPPTLPPRDAKGTSDGHGVLVGIEVQAAASGMNAYGIWCGYTDCDGVSGRYACRAESETSFPANAFYALNAGYMSPVIKGVRKVDFLNHNGATAGVLGVVLFRPLATLDIGGANLPARIGPLTGCLPKIHKDSCLFFLFYPSGTTSSTLSGNFRMAIG